MVRGVFAGEAVGLCDDPSPSCSLAERSTVILRKSPHPAAIKYVGAVWILAGCLPGSCLAGAWTQPPGAGYVRLSGAGIDSRSQFDASGARIRLEASGLASRPVVYRGREARGYAEAGVREGLTAFGSFTYKRVQMEQPAAIFETRGGADLSLGARIRMRGGRLPLSVAGEVKVPTGYSTMDSPALGTGRTDVTIRALAGASYDWGYATADAGWSARGGEYQDQILGSVEVGVRAARRFPARAVLRGVRSVGRSAANGPVYDPSLASPRSVTLDLVGGAAIAAGVELEAGISSVLGGRNALAGTTVEVGMAWAGLLRRGP